jgi:uncharacterized membrane protein YtjA (UPF0391 family)
MREYIKSCLRLQFLPDSVLAEAGYAVVQESCGSADGGDMLYYALVFLIIALVAALFGFAGIATAAAGIAKILFYIFLVIFLVTLVMGIVRRGTSV